VIGEHGRSKSRATGPAPIRLRPLRFLPRMSEDPRIAHRILRKPCEHPWGQMRVPRYDRFEPASARASASMRRVRGWDTSVELALRRALWRRGLRYRLHAVGLPGKPDIIFPTEKVAVFCDGDFWHGRDWPKRRARLARGSNPEYWIPKIKANRIRDRRVDKRLAASQWRGIRVWESDIREDAEKVARRIERILAGTRRLESRWPSCPLGKQGRADTLGRHAR
jgi:DNA mismatch endonuclease, patch repair protein